MNTDLLLVGLYTPLSLGVIFGLNLVTEILNPSTHYFLDTYTDIRVTYLEGYLMLGQGTGPLVVPLVLRRTC